MHRLKITAIDPTHAKIYLDDKELSCHALTLEMRAGDVHAATLSVYVSGVDYEGPVDAALLATVLGEFNIRIT